MCHIMPIMMNMCIVSDGNDFMESMSEYMEIWKRDEVVLAIFGYDVKRDCLCLF